MKLWILVKAEANNLSYNITNIVYNDYEKAHKAQIDYTKFMLMDLGYSNEEIETILKEPKCDAEGNDYYEDENSEFYAKLIPAESAH